MGFPSKKSLVLEVKKQYKGGGKDELEKLCNQFGCSMSAYYKWTSPRMNKIEKKPKAVISKVKKIYTELPSRPTTLTPPTLVASPVCPTGYVMVMVPLVSLANLFGDGGMF